MTDQSSAFRDMVASAARDYCDRYAVILREHGATVDQIERFGHVAARMFVDGVCWTLGGHIMIASSQLADLDQIGHVLSAYRDLSAILEAFKDRHQSSGDDVAGQSDPRTSP